MVIGVKKSISFDTDAVLIPMKSREELWAVLPEEWNQAFHKAASQLRIKGEEGEVKGTYVCIEEKLIFVVFVGVGNKEIQSERDCFLNFAKAFHLCQETGVSHVSVLLDQVKEVTWNKDIARKLCQLPFLVSYQFNAYKSKAPQTGMEQVEFITERDGFEELLKEGTVCGESTQIARDLINHPAMFMTPSQLCLEANKIGRECNIEVKIFKKDQIEAMGMGSFLAVAKGAEHKPRLIVMRYRGGDPEDAPIALVGKGIMFDSGGYDIKSNMLYMHSDMGGAAAVIGGIRSAALMKLKVNVVAVVAACKNMISGDAYVAGDVLYSMNGKTIEMVNSDAEGRLTLADAITYAIRKENAKAVIDIATLTGAAKGAVGNKTAPVISNDDQLFSKLWQASRVSCEKIWRLDADKELRPSLDSSVADLKNTDPGSPMGGGSIVAGLFIREFVEEKPWAHIDIAAVNWLDRPSGYLAKGATGYGVSLLYEALKAMGE